MSFLGHLADAAGVFAAETHFYSEKDKELRLTLLSDDPCRLYLNGGLIGESGRSSPGPARQDITGAKPRINSIEAKIELKEGWNRLLVTTTRPSGSMGFVIVLPTVRADTVDFSQKPDENSENGWLVAGPLKMPYEMIDGSLRLDNCQPRPFTPSTASCVDGSSLLDVCEFKPGSEAAPERASETGDMILRQGQYAIFDLERVCHGFPTFEFSSDGEAVVDVVCGDSVVDNCVPPVSSSGRSADTILLAGGDCEWHSFSPRGARQVMAAVRKAPESGVRLNNPGFIRLKRERDSMASFKCSDDTLNKIWDVGVATLDNTVGHLFMSSPFPRRGQLLHSAMVQSLASFYVYGDYDTPRKAIQEFAAAQLENGAIPAAAPTGLPKICVDLSLLWPVWLDYHFLFAGDVDLAKQMAPGLGALLGFLEKLTKDKLLSCQAMEAYDCFIDRGIALADSATAVNALYCRSLLSSAKIFERAGDQFNMERCQRKAAGGSRNA